MFQNFIFYNILEYFLEYSITFWNILQQSGKLLEVSATLALDSQLVTFFLQHSAAKILGSSLIACRCGLKVSIFRNGNTNRHFSSGGFSIGGAVAIFYWFCDLIDLTSPNLPLRFEFSILCLGCNWNALISSGPREQTHYPISIYSK